MQLSPYNFKISGSCITCVYYIGCLGLKINQTLYKDKHTIRMDHNIVIAKDNTVNTYGDFDMASFDRPRLKYVNGIDVRNCKVLIKLRSN